MRRVTKQITPTLRFIASRGYDNSWHHGRRWLWLWHGTPDGDDERRVFCLTFEWALRIRPTMLVGFDIGHEDTTFRLGTPLGSLYLSFEPSPTWLLPQRQLTLKVNGKPFWVPEPREFQLGIDGTIPSDPVLRWALWTDPDVLFDRERSRWRAGYVNLLDRLLGRQRYWEDDLGTTHILLGMPEGAYNAKVHRFRSHWRRPRWPFTRSIERARVSLDPPAPVPGKGENSWDCGDDAIWDITLPARTVQEALAETKADIMETRDRYGGPQWAVPRPIPRNTPEVE